MLEVVTAVNMSIVIIWVITLCDLVGGYAGVSEDRVASIFILNVICSETMITIYRTTRRHNP
jgi:hypothetical protein